MEEYKLTNAELAILSLISEKPRHGYELEGVIEERGIRAWTDVAFSSIYFILNGLVKKGLASAILQPAAGRGPAKKVFTATPQGQATLHEGIRQAVSSMEQDHRGFMLALSCLPLLKIQEVENAFELRHAFLTAKIEELEHHPTLTIPGIPLHVRAMFEYSLVLLKSELDWSQKFLISYLSGENQYGKAGPKNKI